MPPVPPSGPAGRPRPGQPARPHPAQPGAAKLPGEPGYAAGEHLAAAHVSMGLGSIGYLIAQLVLPPVVAALQESLSLTDQDVCNLLAQLAEDRGCNLPPPPPEPPA